MSNLKIEEERRYTWIDSFGDIYRFYQHPLAKACSFILIQETCERLAYFGIQSTIKSLLRKNYGFDDVQAGSFVGVFSGLTYLFTLLSAVIADTYFGAYLTILVFSVIYMFGLVLICVAAISFIDQLWLVYFSLWLLLAMGAGGIKSCVTVLGGQQYSPIEQKDEMAQFFTFFYASTSLGALLGGVLVPIVAQLTDSYTIAYVMQAVFFGATTLIFIYGSRRYVLVKPHGSAFVKIFKVIATSIRRLSIKKCRISNGGHHEDQFIDDAQCVFTLVPVFVLMIPFGVCETQVFIGYETQGTMMRSHFFNYPMAHEMMINLIPISIIIGSSILDKLIFPFLKRKNWIPTVMVKFAIGFVFACISNFCAIAVWYAIRASPPNSVSIWWQVPQTSAVAIGGIFIYSTCYEIAFSKSPESLKSVSTAFFLVSFALSGFISAGYVQLTQSWIENNQWQYYFGVLAVISVIGGIVSGLGNNKMEQAFKRNETLAQNRELSVVDKSELSF